MWPSTWAARLARGAAALFAVAAVAGSGAWALQQRPPALYRIGLVAPFEGLYRETGYAALSSTRQQVADLNARLACSGSQFQVWAVDDGNDPDKARDRAAELAADPLVLLVLGHFSPETTAAGAQVYAQAGLTVVSPVAVLDGHDGMGVIASLSPCPSAIQDAMSTWASGDATASRLVADAHLLDLEQSLVTGAITADEVILPYTYCPAALVAILPQVRFFVATAAGLDGDVAASSAAAAQLAASVLERAVSEGRPTRASVTAAAASHLEEAGWARSGLAYCDTNVQASVLPCQ